MTAARSWWRAVVFAALLIPTDATAQGRGRGGEEGRGRDGEQDRGRRGDEDGRGPEFCRSGEGHPVFGWRWCEERGWGRDRNAPFPRTYPDGRRHPSSERHRFPSSNRFPDASMRNGDFALDNGYADGYEKGLDDGRDRRDYDPVRHDSYRRGDGGYDTRYGSRAQYQNAYRDGFRSGYEAGYRDGERTDRGGLRFPWRF